MCAPTYRSTSIRVSLSRLGTRAASAVRRPRKACIPPPLCSLMGKDPTSASVNRNRANITLMKLFGSRPVPRTLSANWDGWGGRCRPCRLAAAEADGVTGFNKVSDWVDSVFASLSDKSHWEWKNVFLEPKVVGLCFFSLPPFWGKTVRPSPVSAPL